MEFKRALIETQQDVQKLLTLANKRWKSEFHFEKYATALSQCIQWAEAPYQLSEDSKMVANLKVAKQAATALCAVYRLCEKDGEPPKDLDSFAWFLGQLNDHLAAGLPKGVEGVRKLLPAIEKLYSHDSEFVLDASTAPIPATKEEVLARIDRLLTKTDALLAKNELTSKEAHDVRKAVRQLARVLELREVDDDAKKLKKLSDQLGEIHDGMVKQGIEGKVPYETARVVLAPELKRQLQHTLFSGRKRE